MRNRAIFGPAGQCEAATAAGVKSTVKLLEYLKAQGVDLLEYQCGRGVNIREEKAREIGERAAELGITLTLHAPYYISLASAEPEKRDNSIGYILQSARAASWMGAERIVVHPGGIGKYSREQAYEIACDTLSRAMTALREEGLEGVTVCPEVMGKINQLGNLEEVLGFCRMDEALLPCVDFGHLNSRMHGGMDYTATLDAIVAAIGEQRAGQMHIHFSKIEYSKGGEVKHLTFEDTEYGPEPQPLMQALAHRGMTPVVVCESSGTQTADAFAMKCAYLEAIGKGVV